MAAGLDVLKHMNPFSVLIAFGLFWEQTDLLNEWNDYEFRNDYFDPI